ncbi:hypothetical protein L207DRAFT_559943 [Hyaloscypha variabilis F]|uniref:Uncharacterized protein n=1 Tax=Hyaloscypha variabilis (strain UAMH 11265 / GT02V1 / F) TaxID=1149755 RepID=A0A2J6SBV2_HYAVF|nr:hypothetical protein L207DRAFT_559943 [Hyaloscypha variabilis F]
MPLHIIPRRIFAHRVACKALYRACLTQLPRIPVPNDIPSYGRVPLLKHLIRKGFKKNIHIISPRLAVQELKRGYAAEELLRNAGNGNGSAITQIQDLLRTTAQAKQHSRLVSPPRPPRPQTHNSTIPAPFPGAPKVLDIRPLPASQLAGQRHVPVLTAAGWVPFLRFKKPQSRFLGRVLRDKLKQKLRRWEGMVRADDAMEVGEAEGLWEGKVARRVRKEIAAAEEKGVSGVEEVEKVERMKKWLEEEGSKFGETKERFYGEVVGNEGEKERRSMWAAESARQKFELWGVVNAENEKSLETGRKMLEIVRKEKELWAKERQERRDVKRAKKGKGPGGRGNGDAGVGGSPTVKQEQETIQYKPLFWNDAAEKKEMPMQSPVQKGKVVVPDATFQWPRGTRLKGQSLKQTKPETEGDMMERKLKAMQLSQRNAEKASRNAAPTF